MKSKFWKALNVSLINFEIELILTWSKNCVLADMTAANNSPTGLEFQITERNCTFQLLLCQKKMTNQPQDNSLNYLIDLMFTKVNRLFVLSFVRNAEGGNRDSFFTLLCTKR